jgi:hypothetical protein
MSNISRLATWFLALGLAGVIACARHESDKPLLDKPTKASSEQPPSSPPIAQAVTTASQGLQAPADVPKPVDSFLEPVGMPMTAGMAAADRWLRALRDGDEAALRNATQYPFEWRSTETLDCPAKQPAETAEEFSPIVSCLLTAAPLRRALPEHDQAGITELPVAHLQDWAQPWRQDARPGATLVNAFIKRSDLQLDMDLWVINGSVQAFWMHTLDGASEVAIVKRWLEALKNRDARALAEVTSYPFEVRDTGREAKCGRRTAINAAALESATKCLFTNAELNHALTTNRPFIESTNEDYEVPNWGERWLRGGRYAGLKRVSAGAYALQGFSFDMVVLVDTAGVRAFWMYGSLESTD